MVCVLGRGLLTETRDERGTNTWSNENLLANYRLSSHKEKRARHGEGGNASISGTAKAGTAAFFKGIKEKIEDLNLPRWDAGRG